MPLIYNKHFTATVVGGRFVELACDKCRCEFAYELIRVGKGEADALFGVRQISATKAAVERSQQSLNERLAVEAELVPCPKCRWVNEGLIEGYRLGRYRKLLSTAVGFAIVAIGVSLIAVWFLAIGPEQDRGAIPYVLAGSVGGGAALVIAAWALSNWLRGQIQPNANYPSPPQLPSGTPRVYLKDADTGEYRLVPSDLPTEGHGRSTITLQLGTWSATTRCCSCLEETPEEQRITVPALASKSLHFPYCSGCAVRRLGRSFVLGSVAFLLLLPIAAWLSWLAGGRDDFAWIFGLSALACLAAGAVVGHLKTVPVTCRVVDEGRGVVRLWFRNPEFIAEIDPDAQNLTQRFQARTASDALGR